MPGTVPPILTDSNTTPRPIARLLPFLQWLPRIDRHTARSDLLAGLTGSVIVLPQCVAFATLAGLPVEYGLYCAMIPVVIAALFGSSWHLVSGPTSAISIVLFASLAPLAEPGSARYIELALTVTLLCGMMQLAMGFARLGTLVNFISHTVIIGFMAAAAVVIINAQVRTFFGVDIPRGSSLVETWTALLSDPAAIDLSVLSVSLVTLLAAIALRRYLPRLPYMIGAMIIATLVAAAITQSSEGPTTITTVGALPAGLPPLSIPSLSLITLRETAAIALAITILGLTEAASIARSIAIRSGQRIDSNQEFIGQGLSNIAGAFFSSYASSGSFNRSGLNHEAGARTPLAAASSALFLLAILFVASPLTAWLPHAAMAAVLVIVAWGLIDFAGIRQIVRSGRSESGVLALTFVCGVLVSLEFSILVGVMLSLLLYLNRTSRPILTRLVPADLPDGRRFVPVSAARNCPQLVVVRLDGSLFYGAVDHVRDRLLDLTGDSAAPHHLLLVGDGINLIDIAGAHLLEVEAARLAAAGGGLYLAGIKPPVRELLERAGTLEHIGTDRVFATKSLALPAIYARLDSGQCRDCEVRLFAECQSALPDHTLRASASASSPGR